MVKDLRIVIGIFQNPCRFCFKQFESLTLIVLKTLA